jgi:hypothetical protein
MAILAADIQKFITTESVTFYIRPSDLLSFIAAVQQTHAATISY